MPYWAFLWFRPPCASLDSLTVYQCKTTYLFSFNTILMSHTSVWFYFNIDKFYKNISMMTSRSHFKLMSSLYEESRTQTHHHRRRLRLISLITHLHEFRSLVYVCVYQVDDRLDLFVDGWMTTWCLLIAVVLMIHLLNEQHCQSFTNQFVYSLISVNKQESYLYPDLSILHYLVEQIDLFI